MSKTEKCTAMATEYGWVLSELLHYNDSQVDTLYNACLDEEGQLRRAKK